MLKLVDVVIVGAGPAGLFAAKELAENSQLSIKIIEKGKSVQERKKSMEKWQLQSGSRGVMQGVGGMCLLSNGTLNLDPKVGGRLTDYVEEDRAKNLIEKVDSVFQDFGASSEIYGEQSEETDDLSRRASAADVKFLLIKQRRIGLENIPKIISSFKDYLEENGVEFKLGVKVKEIEKDGVILENGKKIKSKYIIAAPGRTGANWLLDQAEKLGLTIKHGAIDVGVRVEVPSVVMSRLIKISRDPKFYIRTKTFDDLVRTFQINHQGFVVKERYDDDIVCVNGLAPISERSKNVNFALLTQITLTEPVTDTTAYGESIARLATTIGGDRPVVQRLGDLRSGRRSTESRINRSNVEPTLKDVTPGDISMALPNRIVIGLHEALEQLDEIIPGIASNSTLLYAPEIKFYAGQVQVDGDMRTELENLYIAGDGAGPAHDIVNASVTGMISAQSILKETE